MVRSLKLTSIWEYPNSSAWVNRSYRFTKIGEKVDARPAWVDKAVSRAPKLRAERADGGHHYSLTNRGPRAIPSGTELSVDFTEGGVLTTNLSQSLDAGETVYLYVVVDDGEVVLREVRERPSPATGIRLGERAEISLNRVVEGDEFFLGTAVVNGSDGGG